MYNKYVISYHPFPSSVPFILNNVLWPQILVLYMQDNVSPIRNHDLGVFNIGGRDHNHCRGYIPTFDSYSHGSTPSKSQLHPPSTSYNSGIVSGWFLVVRWEHEWILKQENG